MSELSKLFSSALLLAAGFFGASLFGPPQLTQRLLSHWSAPRVDPGQGLRPLAPGAIADSRTLPTAVERPLAEPSFSQPAEPKAFVPPAASYAYTAAKQPAAVATPTAWTTPDFSGAESAKPAATSEAAPPTNPSADFNAWLGSADDWLREQSSPRRDEAVARAGGPVEWLPPRSEGAEQSPAGPSLFAAESAAPVSRESAPSSWSARPLPGFDATPWPASRDASPAPVVRHQASGFGTHVVADGDTLERIAERYLGDASRSGELFDLNRESLESPQLLPIGVVLRVPLEPRRTAPAVDRRAAVDSAPFSTVSAGPGESFAAPVAAEPARLVPVGSVEDRPTIDPDTRFFRDRSW